MKLTKYEQQRIVELNERGFSARKIAELILGRSSRKSTVSDFLKSPRPPYKVETELELINTPNILMLDIETSPTSAWVWGRWKQNIYQDQVIRESFVLSYAAKWLYDAKIFSEVLTVDEVFGEDDSRLIESLSILMDEADIIVAHNGQKFDIPIINTRMLFHKIDQPSPYKIIDTLRIAKTKFRFPSNKLDSICQYLGIDGKIDTGGFLLWKGFLSGDLECIQKMQEYNINDTIILEEVYLKLVSWANTPNLQIYTDITKVSCPSCLSDKVVNTGKFYYTNVNKYEVYKCEDCGKAFRLRKGVAFDKTNVVVGI